MSLTGRKIVMTRYPAGMPTDEDLHLTEEHWPAPQQGEAFLRVIYLSLDPYMRGRMSPAKSYSASTEVGGVVTAESVCEVMKSRADGFSAGDIVLARTGWRSHYIAKAGEMRRIDPAIAPVSTALGVLGMPGFTAYAGLLKHGRPKPGETVVVSAASGAVGQLVGQIAKIKGCRAVGIAGAADKCAMAVDDFGFDACVNYKDADFREQLAATCPDGIDVYFENVAGDVLKAVIPLFNDFARMPVCGAIAYYNGAANEGPDHLPSFMRAILVKRLSVRGFINYDEAEMTEDFIREMGAWLREGRIRYREDFVDGLENTVEAFQGLLTGRNRGKLIIRVSDDPTL
ncbi:MAG: NADP-dependent oxidoreductase [Notoacmeibacter sp.]|nr:NADP-dependent oxidoreductase [Notoacmeibacter sp.]